MRAAGFLVVLLLSLPAQAQGVLTDGDGSSQNPNAPHAALTYSAGAEADDVAYQLQPGAFVDFGAGARLRFDLMALMLEVSGASLSVSSLLIPGGVVDVQGVGYLTNSFPGSPVKVDDADGLVINGGRPIRAFLREKSSLNFPNVLPQKCTTPLTIALPQATNEDSAYCSAALPGSLIIQNCRISSAGVGAISLCNLDTTAAIDPAAIEFTMTVFR